jgi:WD40 repeat protein
MTARIIIVGVVLIAARLASGQEPAVILKHDGWVAAVAFAPDGKTFASAGADHVVRLWEVGTWKPKGVLKGHTDCVCAVTFSDDSKSLMTGSFDRSAKIWDANNRENLRTIKDHNGVVTTVLLKEGPFAPLWWTGSVDGTVRVGDMSLKHRSWVNGITIGPRDPILATASSDGSVRLFGQEDVVLEGGAGEVRCVAFSPDGKLLAAGNRYHTVRVWDVASKKEIKTLGGHMSDVWSIAFSPDGKTLAAADTDWKKPSKVKLWDTATWKERGAIDVPGEILSIAYSPKGDWLAVGSWDKTVRVFAIAK